MISEWFIYVQQTCKKSQPPSIGCGNIFRFRKDKGWNTVEFVETISLNSMNDHFLAWMLQQNFNWSFRKNGLWIIFNFAVNFLLHKIFPLSLQCITAMNGLLPTWINCKNIPIAYCLKLGNTLHLVKVNP